jgi:hypothetical protein
MQREQGKGVLRFMNSACQSHAGSPRAGRLDLSCLFLDEVIGGEDADAPLSSCAWCGETCFPDYVVMAEERCDLVCAVCWGRSAGYLTLREQALTHEAALLRLFPV